MNNLNVIIFLKAKDVQKFFPLKSLDFCWKLLRIIKDSKNRSKVTADDFIEFCKEEFNMNMSKESVIEILLANKLKNKSY